MGDFPNSVSTFRVVGRLMVGKGDSADAGDAPDLDPYEGATITCTPTLDPPIYKIPGSNQIVYQETVPATTDADGYIVAAAFDENDDVVPGTGGPLDLVFGGDPDLNPSGWTWKIRVEAIAGFPAREFTVYGSAGGTVQLADYVPVPANPGAELVQWTAAVSATQAARDAAIDAQNAAEEAQAGAEAALAAMAKGQPNGVASLNSSGKVPSTQTDMAAIAAAPELGAAYVPTAEVTPAYRGPIAPADPPISRAGSFAALSRWLRASVLKPVSCSAGLGILTDSTGTDTSAGDGDGWPRVLAEQLADLYPNVTVRLRRFDHASTLKMLGPEVIQESPLGRPKYSVGVNWAYYLTAPYGLSGLASAKALLDADDLDLRLKFSGVHSTLDGQTIPLITNWGPTGSAADRGIEFYMGTTSTVSLRVSTSSSAWATFNSTVALPYVDNVPIWVRAVLIRNNGASGKTARFYYSTDDGATWTQLGSDVVVAGVLSGVQDTPNWHWEVGTRQGGTGYTLVLNGSPTGGTYRLRFFPDNASVIPGATFETENLAFDADAATVQAAIRAITGHAAFADATVTGTTTKTVTFTKAVRYVSAVNALTGGTSPSVAFGGSNFVRAFSVYEVEIHKGVDGPPVGPTHVWDWEISPSRVGYSGGPMLDIVNFAFSGRSIQNFAVEPYLSIASVNRGQLATIIATSHNEGNMVGAPFVALLSAVATAIKAAVPSTTIAIGTQNPQVSPSVVIGEQSARSAQAAAWAARNGMTVVDTFTAFLDDPRWDGTSGGVLLADDRHPRHAAHESIIAPMMLRAITAGA